VHESPALMKLPLVVLAVGSTLAGLLGVPEFMGGGVLTNWFDGYLFPVLHLHTIASAVIAVPSEWTALAVVLLVSIAGIAAAWAVYGRPQSAMSVAREPAGLARVVRDRFYVDEAYEAIVVRPYYGLCRAAAAIDEKLVDGLVNAAGAAADLASQMLRLAQTGYVRSYAFMFFLATTLILIYVLR